jgi:hypothetical protein
MTQTHLIWEGSDNKTKTIQKIVKKETGKYSMVEGSQSIKTINIINSSRIIANFVNSPSQQSQKE